MFEFFCMMHAMQNTNTEEAIEMGESVSTINASVQFVDFGVRGIMQELGHVEEGLQDTLQSAAEVIEDSVQSIADLGEGVRDLAGNTANLVGNIFGGAGNLLGAAASKTGLHEGKSGAVTGGIGNATSAVSGAATAAASGGFELVLNRYVRMGAVLMEVTESNEFDMVMIFVVLFAGALVGVQVGYGLEENQLAQSLDYVILIVFVVECGMKIMANPLAPWRYFTNADRYWNMFDFTIVVVSMPGVLGSQAAMLRLFRLMRIFKIIDKLPKLAVILVGLADGITACGYIVVLMGMIFYIYACLAVSFFSKNDPWHFHRLNVAIESLFRTATTEDWTDLWCTAFYGCKGYDQGFYVPLPPTAVSLLGDFVLNGAQKAAESRYCAANGIPGSGVCDPSSSRCVLLGESGDSRYGCECLGSKAPDLTAGHIFVPSLGEGVSHAAVVKAIAEAPAHAFSFPYLASNNFSVVSEMMSTEANSTAAGGYSMFCAEPDLRYPFMPAMDLGGGRLTYCEDTPMPLQGTGFFVSFIAVSAFILLSLFVGSVLISIMKSVDKINTQMKKTTMEEHDDAVEIAFMDKYDEKVMMRKQAVTKHIFEAWTNRREITESGRQLKTFGVTQLKMVQEKAAECVAYDAQHPKTEKEKRAEEKAHEKVTFVGYFKEESVGGKGVEGVCWCRECCSVAITNQCYH
jgi:uncharacterized protein YoxC